MPKPDLQPVNLGSISRGALMDTTSSKYRRAWER